MVLAGVDEWSARVAGRRWVAGRCVGEGVSGRVGGKERRWRRGWAAGATAGEVERRWVQGLGSGCIPRK